ncbi:MAG: hypothetical protein H6916_08825 [Novosphingobium sp.]|uniref:hypothetical protein n=1 Tax=Novosphingobium sp. TaxID=1874826 RepID=UPI001D9A5912|nr:hypothetical protein [Novosphingobium sp.]MCB2057893.1 hypothetical protein [Novosphingobium sp.]MCP5386902.1 hypothetical protein [Novosphingobium sp.]
MITLKRFRRIEAVMRAEGYGHMIEWSEAIPRPAHAETFAEQAVYVICNSGMMNRVAEPIFNRCMAALTNGISATAVFGHPGKAKAIDWIWGEREQLFATYLAEADPMNFLRSLPWIGGVTSFHLAKNLGADVAKPDVHLERLARRDRTDTHKLCARLSRQTGYRIATIDTVLWRACADGLLDSTTYEQHGWKAAFNPKRFLSRI